MYLAPLASSLWLHGVATSDYRLSILSRKPSISRYRWPPWRLTARVHVYSFDFCLSSSQYLSICLSPPLFVSPRPGWIGRTVTNISSSISTASLSFNQFITSPTSNLPAHVNMATTRFEQREIPGIARHRFRFDACCQLSHRSMYSFRFDGAISSVNTRSEWTISVINFQLMNSLYTGWGPWIPTMCWMQYSLSLSNCREMCCIIFQTKIRITILILVECEMCLSAFSHPCKRSLVEKKRLQPYMPRYFGFTTRFVPHIQLKYKKCEQIVFDSSR